VTADSARTQLQTLLDPLLGLYPGGRPWLPRLLAAAPHGERLGDAREEPGYLNMNLTVMALAGRPCFQYPVAAPPALLTWFIDNPDQLTWPASVELSPEAALLRRALLLDEPRGSRARAQERAHNLMPVRSAFAREWWRFEETYEPDCVLMSDVLVLVLVAAEDDVEPVSDWFPARSRIHQGLEAAYRLADEREHGVIVCSAKPIPAAADLLVRESLAAGTPHLDLIGRTELAEGYLGAVTFAELEALAHSS
jgi:hypothetical protein